MTDPFDAKVFPLVLLGAMWAAFNLFLKSFEMMNKARDKIISPTNGLTRDAREHILLAEYRMLRIATFLFVVAFASFLIWVPFAMPSGLHGKSPTSAKSDSKSASVPKT
jgi:hypothetical protein